jgi:hypothetical protein
LPASTSATTGSYRLELGGQSVPVNAIEGGAPVGLVVSGPPTGGSPFREKHLAGLRYEPIAIAASFGSARPLFDLVRSAWQGMPPQNSGAVMRVGANGRPVSRREFVKAFPISMGHPTAPPTSLSALHPNSRATLRHRQHCRRPAPRPPCPCHRISGSISPASTAPKSPRSIRSRSNSALLGKLLIRPIIKSVQFRPPPRTCSNFRTFGLNSPRYPQRAGAPGSGASSSMATRAR